MKQLLIISLFLLSFISISAQNDYNLIPYPADLTEKKGQFTFPTETGMSVPFGKEYLEVILPFVQQLKATAGINIQVNKKIKPTIVVKLNESVPEEGYKLTVGKKLISIEVSTPQGLFYSLTSLKQLMPVEVFGKKLTAVKWNVPCVEIEDAPRLAYRGVHLDVSRHFMPVSFIYKFIDLLSVYKINRLHWHLTDDQGWRIEIKKYPLLTQIGSVRKQTLVGHKKDIPQVFDGKEDKGFYTQEEIRQIVAYAANRCIIIIPEIEMPGHSSAALAAYPELSCNPSDTFEVAKSWGVFENVYCPTETTFTFLQNVLDEVMGLFPSHYIHIGGDECPKAAWKQSAYCQSLIKELGLKDENQLQGYFIQRIEKQVNSKGRDIIGWDEILDGGLAPNATVMSWRGDAGGIEAANKNHHVIMCPEKFCYLDYYQEPKEKAPLAIGGNNPLSHVYSLNPIPASLPEDKKQYIIGVQANIWTEYLPTPSRVEYMAFPRITALAEVAWSPETKYWDNYFKRLQTEFIRLDLMDVNACQFERTK
jgi:hexosaminidase